MLYGHTHTQPNLALIYELSLEDKLVTSSWHRESSSQGWCVLNAVEFANLTLIMQML